MTEFTTLLDALDSLIRVAAGLTTFMVMANQIIISRRTRLLTAKVGEVHDSITVVASDLHQVKIETNSMKDALVAATAKASHAEGVLDEKAAAVVRDDAAKL